jgi:hypothetical protein
MKIPGREKSHFCAGYGSGVPIAEYEAAQRAAQQAAAKSAIAARQAPAVVPAPAKPITPPKSLYPGLTNDPVWEQIVGWNWQDHMNKHGVGWGTSRTSDAERANLLAAMQNQYMQIVSQMPDYKPPAEAPKTYLKSQLAGFDLDTKGQTLEDLAQLKPYVTYETVDGDNPWTRTVVNDVANVARNILAQPATVSADFIRQNVPGFASLPEQTLTAMGQDWRNAYAHS